MRLKSRGFTLIELLVVVSIIAVLIAILIPSLAAARERARLSVCQTRMRAWGQGFHMYATDYSDALPLDGGDGTSGVPIGKWDDPMLWFNGVTAYMGTGSLSYAQLQDNACISSGKYNLDRLAKIGANSFFVCPSALDGPGNALTALGPNQHTVDDVSTYPGFFNTWGYVSFKPLFTEPRPMLLCYGMNSQLRSLDYSQWNKLYPAPSFGPGDISKMSRLYPNGLVALMAEKRIRPDELPPTDANYDKNSLAQSKVTATRFAARHYKGGNITYADGHVEWQSNKVIANPFKAFKLNYYNLPNIVIWNPSNMN
ncbi:MAG: prepilin-type N-terminal cleavage/methylation domain-containing protein [Phycisphaerae bacterium]